MFGFSLKSKTIKVLKKDFKYSVQPMHRHVLGQICGEASKQQLNEYDAAIMFMMTQINSITEKTDRVSFFTEVQMNNIKSVMSLAKTPYNELLEFVNSVSKAKDLQVGKNFEKKGIHPYKNPHEVPMIDGQGRILLLRNRLSPIQIVGPTVVHRSIMKWEKNQDTSPKVVERVYQHYMDEIIDKTATYLLQYKTGELADIKNYEVGYFDENKISEGEHKFGRLITLHHAFISENVFKPFGHSDDLNNEAEIILRNMTEVYERTSPLIEPLHPYETWEEVPLLNEIGYILILRSSVHSDDAYLVPESFIKEWRETGKHSFKLDSDIKNYEIGYCDPKKYDFNNSFPLAIYITESTVRPFGFSTVLSESSKNWKESFEKWFPQRNRVPI